MIDVMEPVVWPEDQDREQWWATVLGIDISEKLCPEADVVDQQRAVEVDDDGYPRTPHPAVA